MKVAVYGKEDVRTISSDTETVITARPLSYNSLQLLIKKCSDLRKICMSKSCRKRLSKKAVASLKDNHIAIAIENHRGRAIGLKLRTMLKVIEMHRDFRPVREIEASTGIPKSTVHYLLKHAKKEKIKSGSRVFYLK